MKTQRAVVDYTLRRRAVLDDLRRGSASLGDVCDAQPYLLSAARYHGERTARPCPLCAASLWDVHFVYGDDLGRSSGQARTAAELPALAAAVPRFTVYVVEVCVLCSWNHLGRSFVLGHGMLEETVERGAEGESIPRSRRAPHRPRRR